MSLNRYIVRVAPGFLRAYRCQFLLDLPQMLAYLPREGRILDVGSGDGCTDYTIGKLYPGLDITGIEIDAGLAEQANRHNSAANVRYLARRLEEVEGQFDCVTFIDVLHHVSDQDATGLLAECRRLLAPGGWVFVKDVDRRGGQFSYFMDRFVAFAAPVNLRTPDEVKQLVPDGFTLVSERRKWKFPQPHLYFKLSLDGAGEGNAQDVVREETTARLVADR